ncbi:MAG: Jag N-terminal domain-containing protein [Candidatus Lernaella stagnicola]|nr:Jag N-terminal domain-containing protein [Candidatus Lernaella stagnicola]
MTEAHESKQEFTGKTVEDCMAAAAAELGVGTEQLDVEIIDEPGSFKALFGKKARIRARVKGPSMADKIANELRFDSDVPRDEPRVLSPRKPLTPAKLPVDGFNPADALLRIAQTIVPEATVLATENDDELNLDIRSDGSGIFIGRKGATLEAIQFLMTRMTQKQMWAGKRIIVDSEGYRERRVDGLREKVHRLAKRVLDERRPLRTELLDAAMRKIVHSEITQFSELRTRSIGNGEVKRVQIHLADDDRSRDRRPQRGRR